MELYGGTTDAGSDVKAACSKGEFGDWAWCVNHMLSRAMNEAWSKSSSKKIILDIVKVLTGYMKESLCQLYSCLKNSSRAMEK